MTSCTDLDAIRTDLAVELAVARARSVMERYRSLLANHGKEIQGWIHPVRPAFGPSLEGNDYYRPVVGCSVKRDALNIGATYRSTDTDDRDAIERGEYNGERYYTLAGMEYGIKGISR